MSASSSPRYRNAIDLLRRGKIPEGIEALEAIRASETSDSELLRNLGAAYTEVDRVVEAITTLRESLALDPENVDAYTALSYALSRSGDDEAARKELEEALRLDPTNLTALRNMGTILANASKFEEAIEMWLRTGDEGENSPEIQYAIGRAYEHNGDNESASSFYKKTLKIPGQSPLRELARQGLTRIAEKTLKSVGGEVRMDAVMYMTGAMQEFEKMDAQTLKLSVYELAMAGQGGLQINNPDVKHTLKSFPGMEFTGLQIVSYMYAGLRMMGNDMDVGLDLQKEYETARLLHGGGGVGRSRNLRNMEYIRGSIRSNRRGITPRHSFSRSMPNSLRMKPKHLKNEVRVIDDRCLIPGQSSPHPVPLCIHSAMIFPLPSFDETTLCLLRSR